MLNDAKTCSLCCARLVSSKSLSVSVLTAHDFAVRIFETVEMTGPDRASGSL